mmetsp:Transcript_65770/g.109280  ORF Transcript_65770/g.109280 Transcript_65770/m.109280 type:complete len:104 (-) Transcript_65770:101-412(-)
MRRIAHVLSVFMKARISSSGRYTTNTFARIQLQTLPSAKLLGMTWYFERSLACVQREAYRSMSNKHTSETREGPEVSLYLVIVDNGILCVFRPCLDQPHTTDL